MIQTILSIILFLFTEISFAQYDAECFVSTKKEIKLEIDEAYKAPGDSVRIQDTLLINGQSRYVDTMFRVRNFDANPYVNKIVGCRMPEFSFFTLNKEELSINKIVSDFTIISFSSTTYGDVCKARLHQFCRLKTVLKDSLTVINIFEDVDQKVIDYAKNYESNIEFIANADLLTYHYTLGTGAIIYIIDKYKNIIFVKTGQRYNYSPDEIYSELLDKIRAANCSD